MPRGLAWCCRLHHYSCSNHLSAIHIPHTATHLRSRYMASTWLVFCCCCAPPEYCHSAREMASAFFTWVCPGSSWHGRRLVPFQRPASPERQRGLQYECRHPQCCLDQLR